MFFPSTRYNALIYSSDCVRPLFFLQELKKAVVVVVVIVVIMMVMVMMMMMIMVCVFGFFVRLFVCLFVYIY